MWTVDTRWFDVAVIMSLFALGNIFFGHFEQHKPPWRRVLKAAIVLAAVLTLAGLLATRETMDTNLSNA